MNNNQDVVSLTQKYINSDNEVDRCFATLFKEITIAQLLQLANDNVIYVKRSAIARIKERRISGLEFDNLAPEDKEKLALIIFDESI